jgi:16S rRNA (cytosine967-C5)-methyltransferase
VQRWRGALDHVIAEFAKRRLESLDPQVLEILRLSAYQLLHLTRVPASAVVDDGVNLVRRARMRSAAGFVNAVLRRISRSRDALPLPPRPADPSDRDAVLAYFSVTLSHPLWLVTRWVDRYGSRQLKRGCSSTISLRRSPSGQIAFEQPRRRSPIG